MPVGVIANCMGQVIQEIDDFDPASVAGLYAQTKAEATAYVLAVARERGLNATVVHPSGICGPNDYDGNNHLTQLIRDWHDGRLTAGILGGYDFVDVRDVAQGILACCELPESGGCYLLTNRYITVPQIFDMLSELTGRKRIRTFLPLWFIRAVAPLAELYYKCLRQKPLFTTYSVDTLESNAMVGVDRSLDYLLKLGVDRDHIDATPFGLALGSSGITPVQMAVAFGVLGNGGVYQKPISFLGISDSNGNVVWDSHQQQERRQVFRASTAWLTVDMMKGVVSGGTATSAKISGQTVAGKTGTNSDQRGIFFCGMTGWYCSSLWIGHGKQGFCAFPRKWLHIRQPLAKPRKPNRHHRRGLRGRGKRA